MSQVGVKPPGDPLSPENSPYIFYDAAFHTRARFFVFCIMTMNMIEL